MREFTVYRAQPLGDQDCEDTILIIKDAVPDDIIAKDDSNWARKYDVFYDKQAELILDALSHLPQGTSHALLIKLLEKQKVYFKGRL